MTLFVRSRTRTLDCKEIQPVHPKGDQSWVFIGRTDAEADSKIILGITQYMFEISLLSKMQSSLLEIFSIHLVLSVMAY